MKFLHRTKTFISKPENIIILALSVTLIYLILLPLFSVINDSLLVHTSELRRIRGTEAGDFTFYHWINVFAGKFSHNLFYKPLLNTILVAIVTVVIALGIGGLFAWLVTRTDIKHKKLISGLFILPYIMPSWTLAMAWLNFFKNQNVGGAPG